MRIEKTSVRAKCRIWVERLYGVICTSAAVMADGKFMVAGREIRTFIYQFGVVDCHLSVSVDCYGWVWALACVGILDESALDGGLMCVVTYFDEIIER